MFIKEVLENRLEVNQEFLFEVSDLIRKYEDDSNITLDLSDMKNLKDEINQEVKTIKTQLKNCTY